MAGMISFCHHLVVRIVCQGLVPTMICLVVWHSVASAQYTSEQYRVTENGIELLTDEPPEIPDGELAYAVLQQICDLGPRVSTSPGMQLQQQFLQSYFQSLGATVIMQPFEVRHPVNQTPVQLNNVIVRWHPERRLRVLVCCHFDTRPFPDRDKTNPQGVFLGANDGASGVGMLCELGRYMPSLESEYGVDFVFFDGEEFVYQARRDPLFLGSTFFAQEYKRNLDTPRYSAGVLVDMIGDKDLTLYLEKNSWRQARQITKQIWDVAERQGVTEFIPRTRYEIRDDHLPLMNIAGIPTCDIIDFDYPVGRENIYWHTEADTPDKCSAESLGKVAKVVLAWLRIIRSQP
ncbi:MAG: M28 family peptidase [Pirellulaceae bacterium]